MIRQRIFNIVAILAVLGLLLGGVQGVAAQGDVGAQHTDPNWHGVYFNNTTLSGAPALERQDPALNFNWGTGSPAPGVLGTDNFSARWTRYIDVAPGTYRFTASSDDGVRVWVDNRLIIDRWSEHPVETYTGDIQLGAGHHLVVVEYFEAQGGAQVAVDWAPAPLNPSGWLGQYYANPNLSGSPAATRDDQTINFDWGYGSPFPSTIPADNFSARWTRTINFEPGNYTFYTTTDDGVRLWVNGHLLIDKWHDQPPTTHSGTIYLNGRAEVKMEYYERGGTALARLYWEKGGSTTPPSGGAGSTTVYVVRYGDTLSSIARRFGTSVQAIMAANRLNSTWIYAGQRLVIPTGNVPPTTSEVVVDDGGAGFTVGGRPASWRFAPYGYNGRMTWTLNNTYERAAYNWARWSPRLAAGRYEVYVFVPRRNASTHRAIYAINHADGSTSRVVDQWQYADEWVSLGTYRFSGVNDSVVLTDITGEPYLSTRIGFDAVKWVPR